MQKKYGLLAGALALSFALTACGSAAGDTAAQTATADATQAAQAPAAQTESAGGDNAYEVATVRWADWGEDYHLGFPDKAAEEAGISLTWDTILNSDWADKKAVLLAGGDLPDAFMGSICFSESDVLTNTGSFIALDDYIDEYMPNFKAIMEADPTMKALATSYAILAESADIYRRKVVERIGEHKEDEVRGAIAQDEFAKDADRNDIQVVNTQGGSYLFKDQITKQYFRADADFVRKMQNRVNEFYKQGENFVTVSEWYSYLGLESPGDPVGMLGWPASCGIKFELNSCICPGGEPGYYIMYDVMPMTEDEAENYDRNHYVSDTYDY